jgi:NAD+ synthase
VGFTTVIALSGLDSTLSCYLAAEALGAENVLAVRMPHQVSSGDSLEHAQRVIERLGVQSTTIPIADMVDGYLNLVPDADQVRRGNVMARARMIVMYDQSEVFNALVVGTSNKTEILLGYTTLFGDSASALNPLGDLYKTQVRQLSRAVGVPEEIIQKPPSADLWKGQTDEGELGSLCRVDQLLYLLVDQRTSQRTVSKQAFGELCAQGNRSVAQSLQAHLAPIAKLSNAPSATIFSTFGIGDLMLQGAPALIHDLTHPFCCATAASACCG